MRFSTPKGVSTLSKVVILAFFVAYGLDLIRYFEPDCTGKIL